GSSYISGNIKYNLFAAAGTGSGFNGIITQQWSANLTIAGNRFDNSMTGQRNILIWHPSITTIVENNEFNRPDAAGDLLYLGGAAPTVGTPGAVVRNNKFNSPGKGLVIYAYSGTGISVTNNDFGNVGLAAIELQTPMTSGSNITATCNWWGQICGPVAGDITTITGATVTSTPWTTDGTDNNTSATGFQPLPGTCNGGTAVTVSESHTDNVCFGGTSGAIDITVSGGVTPYSFSWSNSSTSEDLTGISAGTYSVTITDFCSATTATSVTITEPAQVTASGTATDVSCFGGSNGSIDLAVSGGSGSYTYSWSNSETTQDITGLTAGNYSVAITESNGCTVTGTTAFTIGVGDNQPPSITCPVTAASYNTDASACNYTGNFAATATDNCVVSGISYEIGSSPITFPYDFPIGTTTVTATATDSYGLTASCSFDVTVNDEENPTISCVSDQTKSTDAGACSYTVVGTEFDPTAFDDNCTGATVSNDFNSSSTLAGAVFSKGTTSVTWTVLDASGNTATCSFDVTVNDNEAPIVPDLLAIVEECSAALVAPTTTDNCAGTVTGTTTDPVVYSAQGSYSVTWTFSDGFGNTSTATQSVTIDDVTAPTANCKNASIYLDASGSATLSVSDVDDVSTDNCSITDRSLSKTSFDCSNRGPNTVTLTVTDVGGNTATCSSTVTVVDNIAPVITGVPASFTSSTACSGPVTWTPPTAADNCGVISFTSNKSPGDVFPSGTTTVTYTAVDASGNSTTASFTVTVVSFSIGTTQTNVTCFGANDGTATVNTLNTQGVITYLWSNGATTQTTTGLSAGTYTVTVTVGGSCSQSAFVVITSPARLNANTTSTDVSCFGGSNGTITFSSPTGGSGNYEFSITNGAFWQIPGTFSGLSAGSYTLLIRDASNRTCYRSLGTATINQPNQLSVTINASSTTSCQGTPITLTANVSGPSTGMSYLWSNLATTNSISVSTLGTTSYSVRATNSAGCSATSPTVSVTINPSVTASVTISSNISGPVSPSTSITFTATAVNGGTSPVYTWKRNGTTVGSNSSTYTGTGWTSGESVQCTLTSNAPCVSGSPATSNTIFITVSNIVVKYVVSDVTANRVYYYDPSFTFIQSNPLSTNVLNGVTNAEDVWATPTNIYILDGINKCVYRSNGAGTVSTVSRPLRNDRGQGLNPLTGIAIIGNHLLVVDKKAKAIYRYDLAAAFSGSTSYTALQKIALNTSNANAEALSYDPATNAFYVLDNSSTKAFYRYLITAAIPSAGNISIGSSVRSRPMLTNTGAALSTPTGSVVDGTSLRITDRGLDRSFDYNITSLFTGTTPPYNALSVSNLNSGNLNSTGISLVGSTTLIRGVADGSPVEENLEAPTEDLVMYVYPNPAHDYFKVFLSGLDTDTDTRLGIFDMAGRNVHEEIIPAGSATFDKEFILADYQPGFYLVVVLQGDQRKVMRLVVQ
ncbi:MAG: hypothetical protein RL213_2171, partial [Bacteroidota bacterium]